MTGPKGHVVGSKLWWNDNEMCLCPLIKHTAGRQQYKAKPNLLYKTGSQHFKTALDKSLCNKKRRFQYILVRGDKRH